MREFFKRRGIPAIIVSCEGAVVLILLVIVLVRAGTRSISGKDASADSAAAIKDAKSFSFVAEVDKDNKGVWSSDMPSDSSEADEGTLSLTAQAQGVSGGAAASEGALIDIDSNQTPLGDVDEGTNEFIESIKTKIAAMSVEDKISQLFIVTPEDFTGSAQVSVAGTMTRAAVADYAVGGFVYSKANYWDDNQASILLFGIRELILDRADVPCFIMTEGTDETGEKFLTLSLEEYDDALIDIISGRIQNIVYDDDDLYSFYGFMSESDDPDLRPANIMFDCDETNALPALLSGADMLYVKKDFAKIYSIVFDAVVNGDLPIDTVDEALLRIYSYKLMSED